jgi:hypothetical protein
MNAAIPLKERVLAAAAATPSLTRTEGRRLASLLVTVSIVVGLGVFALLGGLAHARDRPLAFTVRLADGCGLAAAALTWLVLGPGAPRYPKLLSAVAFAAPMALLLWMQRFPGLAAGQPGNDAWRCLAAGLVIGATPLASFLGLRRAVEPLHPRPLGAAAGAASGAWANVLLLLWCPVTGPPHVLIGHVAPLVLLTLAGRLLGPYTLGVRWGPRRELAIRQVASDPR